MGELTVAIVNYESAGAIRSLLAELAEGGVGRATIVDNQSSESDRRELASAAAGYDWVELVYASENGGFGRGVNQAIDQIKPDDDDVIWILNPDIVLSAGAGGRLRALIDADLVDIVSPVILAGEPSSDRVWYAGGTVDWSRGVTMHDHWGARWASVEPGLRRTTFIPGAAPMLSGRTWRRLGGFREDFFLYFEDADLCIRAMEMGLRLGVDCSTPVWHAEGGSSQGEGRGCAYYEYMSRNRVLFFGEWAGDQRWLARRARDLETVRLIVRALRERQDKGEKARAVLAGHVRALREGRGQL